MLYLVQLCRAHDEVDVRRSKQASDDRRVLKRDLKAEVGPPGSAFASDTANGRRGDKAGRMSRPF
jgi:hypothetical protein